MVIVPYVKELQGPGTETVSMQVQGYNFLNMPLSTEHEHF